MGQPVTVTADIYGGSVTYHGHIEGLGAGSGSAFALLPPQNASGNWIKIVQRVPVRIALDPQELARSSLARGPVASTVSVDVRDTSGPLVTSSVGPGGTRADTGEDSGPAPIALIARILARERRRCPAGRSECRDGVISRQRKAGGSVAAPQPPAPLKGGAAGDHRAGAGAGHLHAGAGFHHRQCLAAHHRRQSGRLAPTRAPG